METTPIRWGILGCGNIAHQFATGLQAMPDAKLAAVGSRSQEKAERFGEEFQAAKRYGSYEALAADPDIDIVYVATPHPMHEADALLSLAAGKAVLCEKPFTINTKQAENVVKSAREKKLFLMEAMWTRFFPVMAKVRELLAAGAIGEPRMLQADFGFRAGIDPEGRLFKPALGGGALLDVGVYTVSLASMIFGTPTAIVGLADIGETGVDEQAGMVLKHGRGEIAILSTAIRTNTPHEALISGTDGQIKVQGPWWKPTTITVSGKTSETFDFPFASSGFQFEAKAAMDSMRQGKTENEIMPLDETLAIMRTLDALRAQWGLKYPME